MEIGKASATDFFAGSSATSLFSVGQTASATEDQLSAQAIVAAQQREINRIRGYKLQLTPADNQRLGEIQNEILKIQEKAGKGIARLDELEDRVELYQEADRILGKPVLDDLGIDSETDEVYIKYVTALESLLEPNLNGPTAKRVAQLESAYDSVTEQIAERPDSQVLIGRLTSISKALDTLKPLKRVSSLSVQERVIYDNIVQKLNDYVGVKLQLESKEMIRVNQLEQSIQDQSSNLPSGLSSQPTSGSVTRALNRFA